MSLVTINLNIHADGCENRRIDQLIEIVEHIMATVEQLKQAVAAEAAEVKAKVDALEAEVKALKDQVAAGGTITEAQLDDVLAGINGIFTPAGPVPDVT